MHNISSSIFLIYLQVMYKLEARFCFISLFISYIIYIFEILCLPHGAPAIGFTLSSCHAGCLLMFLILLCSLDKRSSILDLRLECQDLEKISLINRFAKFYGRGQADRAETSSTSAAIASPPKFFIQRYVSAVPMPRNVPDKVQCLPL